MKSHETNHYRNYIVQLLNLQFQWRETRLIKSISIMVLSICAYSLLPSLNALGNVSPKSGRLPNIDARMQLENDGKDVQAAASQIAYSQNQSEAIEILKERLPGVIIRLDSVTGAPRSISSRKGFLTQADGKGALIRALALEEVSSEDPNRVVKAFINEYAAVFGHDADILEETELKKDSVNPRNGLRTVIWQQQVDGIPVFEGLFIAHLTKKNELVSVQSQFIPTPVSAANEAISNDESLVSNPSISAKEAVVRAANDIHIQPLEIDEDSSNTEQSAEGGLQIPLDAESVSSTGTPTGPEKKQRFTAPGLLGEAETKLVWLPMGSGTMNLCWQIVFTSERRNEMFLSLVDVQTGKVIIRNGLTEYLTNASYRVYTSDSPSPYSPGHSSPSTIQPPVVSRDLVEIDALSPVGSPNGWIDDLDNTTLGNNVEAHLDLDANNIPDPGSRPVGSPFRVFDFAMDLNMAPGTYRDATVVQLFYLNNWIHDKLYDLGFTESARNFQADNFGRGGLANDAVQADAQDGSGVNNANFSTPPDGSAGRMQMYLFDGPNPDRDGDLDAEIVIHEYCHGLSNRRVGGGAGLSALQSRGLGEGWSDFYGLALLAEASDDLNGSYAVGAYATYQLDGLTENYYYGIRRYPYSTDMTKNPLTFKDIDPTQADPHTGIPRNPIIANTADQVHNQGQVWCSTLHEVRVNLINKHGFSVGNELSLQLVTDGLELTPSNPTFIEARDAILLADQVNNDGANQTVLWAAFAKRGMGFSASAPSSSTTIGVIESFDIPDDLQVTPNTDFISSGSEGGPFAPTSTLYQISNTGSTTLPWTATKTAAWLDLSSSGGVLAVGATADATVSFNSGVNTLAPGVYTDSIIFSNTVSGVLHVRNVELRVETFAPLPFSEGFESGSLGAFWKATGTEEYRIQVTSANGPHGGTYHVTLDDSVDSSAYSRNELTLGIDLANYENVVLSFWARDFSDEADGPPPIPFTNGADFDGVAISADGILWYEVQGLRTEISSVYSLFTVDLDAAIATHGLSYNPTFRIRFNQYDNYGISTDGIAIDDITITGAITDDLDVSPRAEFESTGVVGGPFTPTSIEYSLVNKGETTLDWAVSESALWLDMSTPGGSLPIGAATVVTASINGSANSLPVGSYVEQVLFSNLTTGVVHARNVRLEITLPPPTVFRHFPMDSDPGWATQGQWGFGQPLGNGGDPVSGYTGPNVYGYNLAGQYPNSMPLYWLTTKAVDCSVYANVTLRFYRWLGVESSSYDHAYIEASNDGSIWHNVWSHTGSSFSDTSWQEMSYDISAVADGESTLYIRWGMGPTDGSVTFCGWNIDDVMLLGQSVDDLSVHPGEDLVAEGMEGGPFTPSSAIYTLSNVSGLNTVSWSAAADAPWVSVAPASGILSPGAITGVTVSLNTVANSLLPGAYTNTVVFSNQLSGIVQTRDIYLEVNVIPGEIGIQDTIYPPNDLSMSFGDVLLGRSRTEQITVYNFDLAHELIVNAVDLTGTGAPVAVGEAFYINVPGVGDPPSPSGPTYAPESRAIESTPFTLYVPAGYSTISGGASVLLLASGSEPTTLRTALSAFPDLTTVDYIDASITTPSLATLSAYDAVVMMSDTTIANSGPLGDVLADYVDAGGRVVQSVASFATGGGWELSGRFVTDDYGPFVHGGPEFIPHTLGSFDAAHPVMAGVTVLADDLPAAVSLKPAATSIADWDNSTPLVATMSGSVVGINDYVFDGGNLTGDDALLFHNAIVYLLSVSDFVLENLPAFPHSIVPGGGLQFNVTYAPGDVESDSDAVVIASNDTDEPEIIIDLAGNGIADYLEVTPDTGLTSSGHPGGLFTPASIDYTISNIGSVLQYWTASVNEPWLELLPYVGTIPTGGETIVTVSLSPAANLLPEGDYHDTITFRNLSTGITQIRDVNLHVFTTSEIHVSPMEGFVVTNYKGLMTTRTLVVSNDAAADGNLDFSVQARETGRSELMIIAATGVGAPPSGYDFTTAEPGAKYEPGRLLVRFAQNLQPMAQDSIAAMLGGTISRRYQLVPGLCLVELEEGTVEQALLDFNSSSDVIYSHPDYIWLLDNTPDDTDFSSLWGMHNTGQTGGTPDADINAPEAWDVATGQDGIVVAVIDTGVDYTHQDLDDNMWINTGEIPGNAVDDDGNGYVDDVYGYDFVNNDGNPQDDHYHGTHCAGTVGAEGNNAEGVVGVCWDVRIMAVKAFSAGGTGTSSDEIASIEYAVLMGAQVMSASWGGTTYDQALKDAIDAAGALGIPFVAAAGNSGTDNDSIPHYPSSYDSDNIIAIVNSDHNDTKSGTSCYGLISTDLAAPGSSILSCAPGSGYRYLSGTSMSTPHVTGACALMMSIDPGLTAVDIKQILMDTVDPTLPGICASGGRMNLANAMAEVGAAWLSVHPDGGSGVVPGDFLNVTVTFDAIETATGTYTGELVVASNDPTIPSLTIPVIMLVEPDDLEISPDEAFESAGLVGGPFTPTSMEYSLTNNGAAPLDWVVSESALWLDVSPTGGTLSAGAAAVVTASVNGSANDLPIGSYAEQIVFSNLMSSAIHIRDAGLEISPPAVNVALFFNSAYVDTSTGTYGEVLNIKAALEAKGCIVSTFTGISAADFSSALAGTDILYIPELENGNLASALTADAQMVIENYVSSGGGLIINGSYYSNDEAFLNSVFGYSLAAGVTGGGVSSLRADATGTAFEGGAPSIPWNDGTYFWATSSLPAGGLSIYEYGSYTTVALFGYNRGNIVFLAYDWYDAVPRGRQDGGWDEVLRRAIQASYTPPDDLTVNPLVDLVSSGFEGGPFSPSSAIYTVSNVGESNAISWAAGGDEPWISVTPDSGVLNPGETMDVTVSLNPMANALAPGVYNDSVVFSNLMSSAVQFRDVGLEIFTPILEVFYDFPMDTDPDWGLQGQWAFGVPQGMSGDPSSGFTGTKVYGYNLAGEYENNLPEYYLSTSALDCSGHENVVLKFRRWLGVQNAINDHAQIDISTNDWATWTTVWAHTGVAITDASWQEMSYDISAIADGQPRVSISWSMGPTDGSITYCGWNIDDVMLLGNSIDDLLYDVDGDGMDDGWEVSYFGSTNVSGGAETDDWDGDGFRDIFEFFAGTDPTNSDSLLEITSFDAVAGDSEFVLKWQSVEDKSYRLMSKESLGDEGWTTNKSSITATPPENTESVIPNSNSGFLSVELE